ncbi:hypothetical protein EYF80_002698 [Liparis tanakae]|uniref:Uncharacterized protein n=1 Tax=Liparis tanakae TaxID=230148 RepID=A0A4Z2JB10_9TELE|nr:hypothetical protein EYF80_002698 [Liparis tanakae]
MKEGKETPYSCLYASPKAYFSMFTVGYKGLRSASSLRFGLQCRWFCGLGLIGRLEQPRRLNRKIVNANYCQHLAVREAEERWREAEEQTGDRLGMEDLAKCGESAQ